MEEERRKTGIDVLGDVPWGTHLCQFYQTREDLLDILLPYFKKGLEENEFCMWVTSEPLHEKEAEKALRGALPQFDQYLKTGQIEIVPHTEWYLKDGVFNLTRVLDAWIDKLEGALARGFDGMRVTGNTAWLEKQDWKNFSHYEEEINNLIGNCRMIAMCTYSLDRCGPPELIDVVQNHQFALIRREGKWELMQSSERKMAEQALKESEEDLRNILSTSPDAITVTNLEGKILECNKATLDLHGFSTKQELMDRSALNLIAPKDRKRAAKNMEKILKDGFIRNVEYTFLTKDANEFPAELSASVIRDSSGKPTCFVAITKDITERKKAEEALKHSAREWHATFDAIGDAVFLTDLKGKILRCNQAMAKFLGKPFREIVGRTCWELVHGTSKPVEGCPGVRMQKSHRRAMMVLPVDERYFDITVDPLLDQEGSLIGAVHIMADITEQRKAQQEIESLSRFPSENPNPVLRVTTDGKVLYTNDAGRKVFKAEVGKRMPERYLAILKKATRSQQYVSFEEQVGQRYFSSVVKFIPKVGYLNMYGTDIADRKKVEDRLKAYQKRLRQLASESTLIEEREKRHLATELHDSIGQLLALCRIKLGELEKMTRASGSRSLVGEVEERLEEIIWHTRSLTLRLGPPVLYELGLEAALEWLAEYMQEQYGIQTKFKVDGEAEPMEEELRVFLFRAVQEMMMNVAKHGRIGKAKVSVWRENERIHITVKDRGVGFDAAILDAPSGKDTGFGLFSIHERLHHIGGDVRIESKPGCGTQVTIVAPLKHE